ncbi:MAG: PEP-CTERM sorting domain-containing protein [Verrucomicrobia bacterium]|nr:PEP-CTERM sorting domain-containing protein [Verrucomicrobiota bacterium]
MSNVSRFCTILGALALGGAATTTARAGHVYGGVIDTNGTPGLQAGDALAFVVNSGATIGQPIANLPTQNATLAAAGGFAGLYLTNGITFTAVSNGLSISDPLTNTYRPAHPSAAGSGSLLQVQVLSVTGPAGATYSFWDEATSTTVPAITFTIGTGITSGTALFNLTDLSLLVGSGVNGTAPTGVNNPPVDPYGHMHGRNVTFDQPGNYTVTYIVHDANGIYADSAPFVVGYTTVVPEPATGVALASLAALGLWRARRRRA